MYYDSDSDSDDDEQLIEQCSILKTRLKGFLYMIEMEIKWN